MSFTTETERKGGAARRAKKHFLCSFSVGIGANQISGAHDIKKLFVSTALRGSFEQRKD